MTRLAPEHRPADSDLVQLVDQTDVGGTVAFVSTAIDREPLAPATGLTLAEWRAMNAATPAVTPPAAVAAGGEAGPPAGLPAPFAHEPVGARPVGAAGAPAPSPAGGAVQPPAPRLEPYIVLPDVMFRPALARHLRPGDVMQCGDLQPRTVEVVSPGPEPLVTVHFTDGTRWYIRPNSDAVVRRYRPGQVERRGTS